MVKNDPKIGFFYYFEKFCLLFLLEIYLNKNKYCYHCANSHLRKFFFLSHRRKGAQAIWLQDSLFTLSCDEMTGSHWFFPFRQIARRGKVSTKFFIGCGLGFWGKLGLVIFHLDNVFTFYISGNILVFKKLEKNKPKQPENVACFGFVTICSIWGRVLVLVKL